MENELPANNYGYILERRNLKYQRVKCQCSKYRKLKHRMTIKLKIIITKLYTVEWFDNLRF